jgi:hypothetical protein
VAVLPNAREIIGWEHFLGKMLLAILWLEFPPTTATPADLGAPPG